MISDPEQLRLRDELARLHELLNQVDAVDSSVAESLQLLATDIQGLLDRQASERHLKEEEWSSFTDRWRDALLDFESQHPRVTQVIQQISNILANAGI